MIETVTPDNRAQCNGREQLKVQTEHSVFLPGCSRDQSRAAKSKATHNKHVRKLNGTFYFGFCAAISNCAIKLCKTKPVTLAS